MEKDNEIKPGDGNSYDFGARMYDPRIGRWLSTDLMEAEAPSWTPFRFGFDNPIRMIDPNGKFEIDEATAAAYPKLNAYLMKISAVYAQKPEAFKKAFKQYSELSDAQVAKMLEYKLVKNGTPVKPNQEIPRIEVKKMEGANAQTPLTINKITNNKVSEIGALGKIILNKDIVDAYEINSNDYSNGLVLESTIFHEGTHYGDGLNGTPSQTTMNYDPKTKKITVASHVTATTKEGGKSFENAAYGYDVDSTSAQEREDAAFDDVIRTSTTPSDRLTKENVRNANSISSPKLK